MPRAASYGSIYLLTVALVGCTTYLKDSRQIIDKTLVVGGAKKFATSTITFDIGTQHFEFKKGDKPTPDSTLKVVFLPYVLADSLVVSNYLGDTMIEGKIFYTIEITNQQGNIRYWINRDDFAVGFIAYSRHSNAENGLRFCKAVNPRKIGGIQFYDYVIHQPENAGAEINDLELLFTKGDLIELNKIVLENIKVH